MKSILFVLSNELYVRNYVRTGVIDSLNKKFNCKVIASNNIFSKDEVEKLKNFVGYYVIKPKVERKHNLLFEVNLWRYRKKSTTFIYRFMRITGLRNLDFLSGIKPLKEFFSFIARTLVDLDIRKILLVFLGSPSIYPIFVKIYRRTIKINKSFEKLIKIVKPDLILFPSSAYDAIGDDIIEIGNKENIKTVFLIDNWDNLSSKTVFLTKPDYLTVWGKQSLEHAIKIHDFQEEKVILIGTPRFDIYYKTINNIPKSPIDGRYILFAGAALEMDEIGALRELDEEIENHQEIYKDLKIIYRPHPWRQGRYDFNESDFKHVELDIQMKNNYLYIRKQKNQKLISKNFQPDINYNPTILGNALFIVAPLTTFALEALILEKRVLLIVYDDGKFFTTPKNVYKYYEHFRGIENLKGFTFCKDKNKLKQDFQNLYLTMSKNGFKSVKSDLSYFLYNDIRDYQQRLSDAIELILGKK